LSGPADTSEKDATGCHEANLNRFGADGWLADWQKTEELKLKLNKN